MMLYPPDRPEGMKLPIPRAEARFSCTKYFPFINAYLVWNCVSQKGLSAINRSKKEYCQPCWLVWPDGRTKRNCIPYGPWVGTSLDILITKIGTMFVTLHRDPKHAGGYLISNGAVSRLMGGFLFQPDVSPDGCRVAFTHKKTSHGGSQIGAGAGYRGRVIDLCDPDKSNMNSGN